MIIVFCVLLATLIIEPKRTWTYLDLPIFAFVLSSFIYTSFLAITLKMLLWLAPLHTLALAEALYFSLHQVQINFDNSPFLFSLQHLELLLLHSLQPLKWGRCFQWASQLLVWATASPENNLDDCYPLSWNNTMLPVCHCGDTTSVFCDRMS